MYLMIYKCIFVCIALFWMFFCLRRLYRLPFDNEPSQIVGETYSITNITRYASRSSYSRSGSDLISSFHFNSERVFWYAISTFCSSSFKTAIMTSISLKLSIKKSKTCHSTILFVLSILAYAFSACTLESSPVNPVWSLLIPPIVTDSHIP